MTQFQLEEFLEGLNCRGGDDNAIAMETVVDPATRRAIQDSTKRVYAIAQAMLSLGSDDRRENALLWSHLGHLIASECHSINLYLARAMLRDEIGR
jgi:hypothetical protein